MAVTSDSGALGELSIKPWEATIDVVHAVKQLLDEVEVSKLQ